MDAPRYLARQAGHHHPEQYTENPAIALPHEPEPIEEEVQRQFSDESRRRWRVLKGEELARKQSRSRCSRLKNVDIAARDRGVDIHRLLTEIERLIASAEKVVWPE